LNISAAYDRPLISISHFSGPVIDSRSVRHITPSIPSPSLTPQIDGALCRSAKSTLRQLDFSMPHAASLQSIYFVFMCIGFQPALFFSSPFLEGRREGTVGEREGFPKTFFHF
jgi:hypothetical protein